MWLLKDGPGLLTDFYELTMAQLYWKKDLNAPACFEVSIRKLPANWGFFVMAGLGEFESFINEFRFSSEDIEFLKSTGKFSNEFLEFLRTLRPDVKIRAFGEGSIFFPNEPILEVTGPLIDAQILESYTLNILGFSIIQASLATRLSIAAGGIPLVDFGLRRSQGPVAAVRAARAAKMANFAATSNLFASKLLDFKASGTMAHSLVQAYESEEEAFRDFAEVYGPEAVLLVDTYDTVEGIKKAASVAKEIYDKKGIKIRGIRIDSGDLVKLTKFARQYFVENGVEFLRIFVSGDLDEYKIAKLRQDGAEIDGFGVGTRFVVSQHAPSVNIVYKLAEYSGRKVFKTSPRKRTYPGSKTVVRIKGDYYEKDIVSPFHAPPDDLLKPFATADNMEAAKARLSHELSNLREGIKRIEKPEKYSVELDF